jgi:hypothetical protein
MLAVGAVGAQALERYLNSPGHHIVELERAKHPYVLEFLGLTDEYSESDFEEALIRHLKTFLLELGGDFCFAGRQNRPRIGDEWYRVDLVFYHRRLRCLALIDLKLAASPTPTPGRCTPTSTTLPRTGSAPARTRQSASSERLARYALGNLPNKVPAAEYRTVLPDEKVIAAELDQTRRMLGACLATKRPSRSTRGCKGRWTGFTTRPAAGRVGRARHGASGFSRSRGLRGGLRNSRTTCV